ncbi:MAG: protein-L-isoaspartate(D-aspartate) O-methyltransferase [Actinomycetota bacterium]
MPQSQEGLARLVEQEGTRDPRIIDAFRTVARDKFVPEGSEPEAYLDRPVGIPEQQTTSQPTLIARMLDAVAPQPQDRALEVGTGYGYQTALLAQLVAEVYSMERFERLADAARANLKRAGITNAEVLVGDGWQGLPDKVPFQVIVVSAAAPEVPLALAEQLAEGGRLIIPIRVRGSDDVYLFEKRDGRLERVRLITPARFVPLVPGQPD